MTGDSSRAAPLSRSARCSIRARSSREARGRGARARSPVTRSDAPELVHRKRREPAKFVCIVIAPRRDEVLEQRGRGVDRRTVAARSPPCVLGQAFCPPVRGPHEGGDEASNVRSNVSISSWRFDQRRAERSANLAARPASTTSNAARRIDGLTGGDGHAALRAPMSDRRHARRQRRMQACRDCALGRKARCQDRLVKLVLG